MAATALQTSSTPSGPNIVHTDGTSVCSRSLNAGMSSTLRADSRAHPRESIGTKGITSSLCISSTLKLARQQRDVEHAKVETPIQAGARVADPVQALCLPDTHTQRRPRGSDPDPGIEHARRKAVGLLPSQAERAIACRGRRDGSQRSELPRLPFEGIRQTTACRRLVPATSTSSFSSSVRPAKKPGITGSTTPVPLSKTSSTLAPGSPPMS